MSVRFSAIKRAAATEQYGKQDCDDVVSHGLLPGGVSENRIFVGSHGGALGNMCCSCVNPWENMEFLCVAPCSLSGIRKEV